MSREYIELSKNATSKAILSVNDWVKDGGSQQVMEATVYVALLGQGAVIIQLLDEINKTLRQTEVNTR